MCRCLLEGIYFSHFGVTAVFSNINAKSVVLENILLKVFLNSSGGAFSKAKLL